jgi:uncharacterized protein YchJ
MRRMGSACCARAASGHVAAALPRSVMNSRRCMCPLENTHKYKWRPGEIEWSRPQPDGDDVSLVAND